MSSHLDRGRTVLSGRLRGDQLRRLGCCHCLEKKEGKGLAIDDYAGLGKKHPALAAAMTVFMLSFIGFPPRLGWSASSTSSVP